MIIFRPAGSDRRQYGLEITTTYLRAFFDATLLDQDDPILDAVTPPFPEVHAEMR